MVTSELRIGGSVVCWKIGQESSWLGVNTAVENLGPSCEGCGPTKKTHAAALSAALAEIITPDEKGHKILVRPRKDGDIRAFVVLQEDPKVKDEAAMKTRAYVELHSEEGESISFRFAPFDSGLYRDISLHAEASLATLGASAVGKVLSDVVDKLGGVSLRDGGGVYWLPERSAADWSRFAADIESAGVGNSVYAMQVAADAEMVRCVGDRMTGEVGTQLESLEAELGAFTMTPETVEKRRAKMEELMRQVENFENAFATRLEAVRESFSKVSGLFGAYSLLQAARQSPAGRMSYANVA